MARRFLFLLFLIIALSIAYQTREILWVSGVRAITYMSDFSIPVLLVGLSALGIGLCVLRAGRRARSALESQHSEALRTISRAHKAAKKRDAANDQREARRQPVVYGSTPTKQRDSSTRKQGVEASEVSTAPPKLLKIDSEPSVKFAKGLYYAPFFSLQSGEIVGYEIVRRGTRRGGARAVYVQYPSFETQKARIRSERATLIAAATETRQVLQSVIGDIGYSVDVPLSAYLLRDAEIGRELAGLFKAHSGLGASLRLSVDSRTLRSGSGQVARALRDFSASGAAFSLNVCDDGIAEIDDDILTYFDAVILSKELILDAYTEASVTKGAQETKTLLHCLETMARQGITILARDVVCEADLVDLMALGVDYASGPFYTEPRPLKPIRAARYTSRQNAEHPIQTAL